MRQASRFAALKQLPRAALFSFGIALCFLMVAAVRAMVFTGGEHAFGPSEARRVFTAAFVISLICFAVVGLLRSRSDSADDEDGGADPGSQ